MDRGDAADRLVRGVHRSEPDQIGEVIFVRGGLGPDAQIGRSMFRRVPSEELEAAVDGLIDGWLAGRLDNESFSAFTRRLSDDELGALAGLEPARVRVKEVAA